MAARQIILTLLALAAIGYGIHRFEHMRKHTDTYCAAGAGYLGGQLLHELERGEVCKSENGGTTTWSTLK